MKNSTLLFLTLLSFSISQAQIVNIPDADFKTALLSYYPAIDTNSDGDIQVSEALAVTSLSIYPSNAQNAIGLEAFTNLTDLNIITNGITVLNLSSLINLQHLDCSYSYQLNTLDLTGLINLQTLSCRSCNGLTSLNLTSLINLQALDCSMCSNLASLNLNGLTNLQTLNCSVSYNITSLDLTGLINLTSLSCYDGQLTSLNTANANNLITLNCSSNNLTSLNVSGMTHLQNLDCSNQNNNGLFGAGISTLDLTGLNFITSLNCNQNNLSVLNISHLTNLTHLNCSHNNLTTLNVTPLTNLTSLSCGSNHIQILDLLPLINLTVLSCNGNQIQSLNLSSLIHLTNLDCSANLLTNINLTNLAALDNLECSTNSLNSLDVSNNINLTYLSCSWDQLSTLNVSNLINLVHLICIGNQLTTLDVSNSHYLTDIRVDSNLFATLDFSQSIIPSTFFQLSYSCSNNPNLTYINIKNGSGSYYPSQDLSAYNCPNLQYICADESSIQSIQQMLNMGGSTTPANVQVNSYCTFVPGGIHNTITGTVTLDNNNNGCDAGDIHPANFKININDGTLTGATFSLPTGGYSFFTQTGSFTLTPQFENNYFIVSPTIATLNFADLDASTQTQNFCITANGIHNDVDIVIYPIGNARPGFDANYILIYKNKGNQILSGTINLAFDDAVLDFVSANPTLNGQSLNNLNWNYSNLLPFESRTINFTLNVNGPTETPAVNIDDVLNYVATINPISEDETTDDNTFTYNQTVRGAFDPNDKICLEGNSIIPERVGDYLHYIIDFQNTGSAPAENIVVRDDIDATKFDISSFELTASSHPQVTRITGNKVEFVFENINLPAQIDNEPASHGYVAFKIKTKSNLVLGNTVSNTANIYFDYNFPIITNTTSTTVSTLGIHDFENATVSISPNPVKNTLSILADDVITSIQLFDVQGRLITTKLNASIEATLDLSQQQNGVYFVKVYTDNGMKVQKVIKQ